MKNRTLITSYCLLVGILMIGQWLFFLIAGFVPELGIKPWTTTLHIAAELTTAGLLIISAIQLKKDSPRSIQLTLISLGALIYAVIQALGYFIDSGDLIFVIMFILLQLLTVIFIILTIREQDIGK